MAAETLYAAAGGGAAMLRVADAWHQRCLAHPVASHPFSHGHVHPEHTARLAAYLGEALGGPPAFTEEMSTERAVAVRHAGNGPHPGLNDIAVALFAEALVDAAVPNDLHPTLVDYFRTSCDRLDQPLADAEALPEDTGVPRWGG